MRFMTKILFICHGNICRSPMAEFVMKDMVRKRGLEAEFEIASAATSREEIGNPVYPSRMSLRASAHTGAAIRSPIPAGALFCEKRGRGDLPLICRRRRFSNLYRRLSRTVERTNSKIGINLNLVIGFRQLSFCRLTIKCQAPKAEKL